MLNQEQKNQIIENCFPDMRYDNGLNNLKSNEAMFVRDLSITVQHNISIVQKSNIFSQWNSYPEEVKKEILSLEDGNLLESCAGYSSIFVLAKIIGQVSLFDAAFMQDFLSQKDWQEKFFSKFKDIWCNIRGVFSSSAVYEDCVKDILNYSLYDLIDYEHINDSLFKDDNFLFLKQWFAKSFALCIPALVIASSLSDKMFLSLKPENFKLHEYIVLSYIEDFVKINKTEDFYNVYSENINSYIYPDGSVVPDSEKSKFIGNYFSFFQFREIALYKLSEVYCENIDILDFDYKNPIYTQKLNQSLQENRSAVQALVARLLFSIPSCKLTHFNLIKKLIKSFGKDVINAPLSVVNNGKVFQVGFWIISLYKMNHIKRCVNRDTLSDEDFMMEKVNYFLDNFGDYTESDEKLNLFMKLMGNKVPVYGTDSPEIILLLESILKHIDNSMGGLEKALGSYDGNNIFFNYKKLSICTPCDVFVKPVEEFDKL